MRKRIEIPVMAKCCGRIFRSYAWILCFAVIILASSCNREGGYVPRTGDLVFQTASESGFSEAITVSTSQSDTSEGSDMGAYINYVHVGIVVVEEGSVFVLEAEPRDGVVLTPWNDFVSSSPLVNGKPGITVMRLTVDFPVDEAVARAKSHIGEPYDWHFISDNGKIYCSELVYDSYLYADGSHIFTAVPMNFRDSHGDMPEFWTELFASFDEPIPEGLLGTNPNDLSRDPHLTEVHRFF